MPTLPSAETRDVLILGAGGAGLMCALHAARRGLRVLILDHADKIGGKILISGGGRCNFTNIDARPANYVSENEHFCKSALSRYTPADFLEMVRAHGIPFHEKKLGQLFCDRSARDIVEMLGLECQRAGVEIRLRHKILKTERAENGFAVETDHGAFAAPSLVVATGGLSIPKIGATGLGYKIAKHFGLRVTETRPALDGFVFADADTPFFAALAGTACDTTIACGGLSFRENILFTHKGLSGPAALQASLHWSLGEALEIDLLPDGDAAEHFRRKREEGSRSLLRTVVGELMPARLADAMVSKHFPADLPFYQANEKALAAFAESLHRWTPVPSGTVGYSKAEVTRGGVDTNELSSKTMEARKVPGLYFVGEVVDVTGWLGGYNFQWAWASGWAAAQALAR
jgi:predicted Rossmann fold flavoprotein